MASRMRFSIIASLSLLLKTIAFSLVFFTVANADDQLWRALENFETGAEVQARSQKNSDQLQSLNNHSFEDAKLMLLNENLMRTLLTPLLLHSNDLATGAKSVNSIKELKISLPLPNGSIIDLTLVNDSILPKGLAEKYPDIKTYRVLANNVVFSGKVDISPSGFHAMLEMLDGEVVFIDPTDVNKSEYAIYKKSAQKTNNHQQHTCGIGKHKSLFSSPSFDLALKSSRMNKIANGQLNQLAARTQNSLKNYTIAIATTGEYSAKFGGSVSATMAAITTTLHRVNQVLERDLGIHLNLVENNDLLINTDAASDPFTETKLIDLVFQNQDFIDSQIGNSNYDIGHLFTTKGGGLAAIASVCNNGNKAKGASGTTSPRGDSFDLDFVAHEIGHQLGATHTFNSAEGACNEETRTARSAFEPGSGSSIMSYAGYCGLDNIQSNTDAMFHIGSIKQIEQNINSGVGASCGVVTPLRNTPPKPDAGRDYMIPARTPFELAGSALDEDDDVLLYAWEQLDAGDVSTQSVDKGNNALFRVHKPNSNTLRSFPPLENLLNHQPAKGETLANYNRKLTMSFVAQDGFNPAQSDEMKIKVLRTGSRFALHYPQAYYTRGSTYPIFWNVANTDKAPINCSSVNISLSLDGGKNFSHEIASNIANNGEALVTIPADLQTSTQGRFKLKCSDNIFFAVSHRNFFVTQDENSITLSYSNENQAEENLADLPLNSEPVASSSAVNTTVSNNNTSSGGGSFNGFILLCSLVLIFIRKLYFSFNRNLRVKKSSVMLMFLCIPSLVIVQACSTPVNNKQDTATPAEFGNSFSAEKIKREGEALYAKKLAELKTKKPSVEVNKALQSNHIYYMAVSAGRGSTMSVPGLNQTQLQNINCKTVTTSGMGDVLYGKNHVLYRQALLKYMREFNVLMSPHCN